MLRRLYSTSHSHAHAILLPVETILGGIECIAVDEFKRSAFIPGTPVLIRKNEAPFMHGSALTCAIPAAHKWFTLEDVKPSEPSDHRQRLVPSKYLSSFQDTILPYELSCDTDSAPKISQNSSLLAGRNFKTIETALSELLGEQPSRPFQRFNAPLSLFLHACSLTYDVPASIRLYIAQAQIIDLPKELQDDLPVPKVVQKAGKGDIYDSNIWLGLPPTYTPLHKDPNPNLFVQLAGSKHIKLYKPSIGAAILSEVRRGIGRSPQTNLRGEEMMEGPERNALDEAVWGRSSSIDGLEAIVSPGDAIFIPQGWWHSIKSIGTEITGSVNWWFR
jgi:hypothetical protein